MGLRLVTPLSPISSPIQDGEVRRFQVFDSTATGFYMNLTSNTTFAAPLARETWKAILPSSWLAYRTAGACSQVSGARVIRYKRLPSGANSPGAEVFHRGFAIGDDTTVLADAMGNETRYYADHFLQRWPQVPLVLSPVEWLYVGALFGDVNAMSFCLDWIECNRERELLDSLKAL